MRWERGGFTSSQQVPVEIFIVKATASDFYSLSSNATYFLKTISGFGSAGDQGINLLPSPSIWAVSMLGYTLLVTLYKLHLKLLALECARRYPDRNFLRLELLPAPVNANQDHAIP